MSTLEDYRGHLRRRLAESDVPDHLHEGLTEYIAVGRPTGHFLQAVLSNDLRDACARVDVQYRTSLFTIVFFLWNYAPGPCWGSPAAVRAWLELGEYPMVFE